LQRCLNFFEELTILCSAFIHSHIVQMANANSERGTGSHRVAQKKSPHQRATLSEENTEQRFEFSA